MWDWKSVRQDAGEQIRNNYWNSVIAWLSGFACLAAAWFLRDVLFFVPSLLILLLIWPAVDTGIRSFALFNLEDGGKVSDVFLFFGRSYFRILKVRLLRMGRILLRSLLLIVPGVIFAYDSMCVPYLLAEDPELDAADAFEKSHMLMDGEKRKAFLLDLTYLPAFLLTVATGGVFGIFYLFPRFGQAHACVYDALAGSGEEFEEPVPAQEANAHQEKAAEKSGQDVQKQEGDAPLKKKAKSGKKAPVAVKAKDKDDAPVSRNAKKAETDDDFDWDVDEDGNTIPKTAKQPAPKKHRRTRRALAVPEEMPAAAEENSFLDETADLSGVQSVIRKGGSLLDEDTADLSAAISALAEALKPGTGSEQPTRRLPVQKTRKAAASSGRTLLEREEEILSRDGNSPYEDTQDLSAAIAALTAALRDMTPDVREEDEYEDPDAAPADSLRDAAAAGEGFLDEMTGDMTFVARMVGSLAPMEDLGDPDPGTGKIVIEAEKD